MNNQNEENSQEQQSRPAAGPSRRKKRTVKGFINALMAPAPAQQRRRPVKQVRYIRPKKGNRVAISLVFITLILSACMLASVGIIFLAREFLGIDKSSSMYIVNIPEDATTDDVIRILTVEQEEKRKEPIIKVDRLFRVLVDITEKRNEETIEYVSGKHNLKPNMGYQDILDELQSYNYIQKETVRVTIKEGMRLRDVAKLLEQNCVCQADKFIYKFNTGLDDYEFMNNIPRSAANNLRFDRMEGYLFPDTYEFYTVPEENLPDLAEEDYEIILRTIYENFESKYDDEIKKRASEAGMTMDQVVTLASIVQLEAKDTADMKNVASVFTNRLNNYEMFQSLQSDPTREYSEYLNDLDDYAVNQKMLTAYNTYKSNGLPPGPICSPGIDAIKAVLWPNNTNNYYFCADIETGKVYYAETYEQHVANLIAAGIDPYDF